jgi:hypothetical protein
LLDAAIQRVEALTRQQREGTSTSDLTDGPTPMPISAVATSAQQVSDTADSTDNPPKRTTPHSPTSASPQPAQSAESSPPLPFVLACTGEAQGSTQHPAHQAGSPWDHGHAPSDWSGKRGNPSPDHSLDNPPSPRRTVQGESDPPLGVANLQLCRKVNGFGSCEPLPSATVRAGQQVLLYCEMTGLRYEASAGSFTSGLSGRLELRMADNETVLWEKNLGIARDECSRARHDYYVSYKITFPRSLPEGPHRLRVVQTDLAANRSATAEIPLTIAP